MPKFEDDKPVECDECGDLIYAGETVIMWNGKNYCCEDCVKDAMWEELSPKEVESRVIYTAEDYEAEWGDQKYDEMRGK